MTSRASRITGLYELDDHPGRILPMEGLRGVAVLLVFLVHIGLFRPWLEPATPVDSVLEVGWQIGQSGVDLFFVLSGYLIYGAVIRRPVRYGRFLTRRLQRIYPVFLVMFVVYTGLDLVLPDGRIPSDTWPAVGYLLANLALLPGIFPIVPLLTVAWSLSYEFFYYLTIPLAVVLLRMRDWQPRQRLYLFLGASAAAFAIGYAGWDDLIRLAMFLAGILVYEVLNGLGWRPTRRWEWLAVGGAALALAATTLFEVHSDGRANSAGLLESAANTDRVLVLFLGFGLLCLVAFRASGGLYRALTWTPLRWLGNMSYSFYLVHSLVLKALELVLGKVLPDGPVSPMVFGLICLFGFALAWIASTALYVLVERPFSLRPSAGRLRATAGRHSGLGTAD